MDKISSVESSKTEEVLKKDKILQLSSLIFKDNEISTEKGKPMVRCVHSVDIDELVRDVLHKKWQLKNPKIVVVVLSNAGPIHNWKDRQQIKAFQKGLMTAAENTNMWLITHGLDLGATTIVGEAILEHSTEIKYKKAINSEKSFSKSNFIGIADIESLQYLQTITASTEPIITISNSGGNRDTNMKYNLQSNLSHYILIEDKSRNKNGINSFINKFMSFLSLNQSDILPTNEGSPGPQMSADRCSIETSEVPVVSLLMKGGYECSRIVLNTIKEELPVVVLQGTGGLADLLAFGDIEIRDRCMNEWNPEFVETYLKPELTLKIVKTFGNLRNNSVLLKTLRNRILESIRLSRQNGQNYLTIINLFEKYSCNLENLTEYLLLALFRSQRKEYSVANSTIDSGGHQKRQMTPEESSALIHKDLRLCIDWNCPEVARNEVLVKDPTFSLSTNSIYLKSLFEESLIRSNRWKFVDLFLSQKFKLRSFVKPKTLLRMFRTLRTKDFFSNVCWEGILGRTVDQKQNKNFMSREFNYLVYVCCGVRQFISQEELDLFVTQQFPNTERDAERKALKLLMFWAVMDFRKILVRILWRYSDHPIHLALIIALCYEHLSWFVVDQQLCDQLKEESQVFIGYAITVLDVVYKDSALRAEQVLLESSRDWNYRTALDLAAFGKFKTFFIHPACQRRLTNQIYGNITVKDVRIGVFRLPLMCKLLFSAYFVLPAYYWIRGTDSSINAELLQQLSEESIDYMAVDNDSDDSDGGNSGDGVSGSGGGGGDKKQPLPKKSYSKDNHMSIMFDKTYQLTNSSFFTTLYYLWTSPITKFWNHQFFYTFYLSIFSIAVLYPRCGHFYIDLVVDVWTFCLVVDRLQQIFIISRLNIYFSNMSSIIQAILQILFIIYFTNTRLIYVFETTTDDAYNHKVIMSLALIHAYYVLFTVFLPISSTLGPLLYRLKLMIFVDFLNFIRLAVLVMISFGVVMQSLIFPDLTVSNELYRRTFHRAFFSMFSIFLNELEVDPDCESKYVWDNNRHQTDSRCSASRYSNEECRVTGFWPYFFEILYLILLKSILLTLLGAIFAASAVKDISDTSGIWMSQRYGLVIDFMTRSPLPPPLNIFSCIFWICRRLCCLCCDKNKETQDNLNKLSNEDYAYLRILAAQVFEDRETKDQESKLNSEHWEMTKAMSEELEYQRRQLRKLIGRTSEMERSGQQSFVFLENIRHLVTKRSTSEAMQQKLHSLSRQSPYPKTDVHRYPVPDKYVSWQVFWVDYDPIAYTKPKLEMPLALQETTDIDILALKELNFEKSEQSVQNLPVFVWNRQTISGAGICVDRQSWHMKDNEAIIYKLEDSVIPTNPFGRTGLRGRGSLPRWGPNHYVMVVITRKKSDTLEVIVELIDQKHDDNKDNINKINQISLIERFISGEITYKDIESLFKISKPELKGWTKSDQMIEFFKSFDQIPPQQTPDVKQSDGQKQPQQQQTQTFKCEKLIRGYFDDPMNTDNAWKELELWHIHYSQHNNDINDYMSDAVDWRDINENLFYNLSLSHSKVIQDIVDTLDYTMH
ncbi:protein ced-11-like [Oppia nitens]|uniref:protein ced-11-like n=1 Tax=Oppia nitens TaxID=1686743 RepID=UPI0023DB5858|nr:protein ced-11-like [Oppia nitens]